jgi:DNA mismatch repair protein MutS
VLRGLEVNSGATAEREKRRSAMKAASAESAPSFQLTMFGEKNVALEELKALDVESLTPIEAMTKLFELQRNANEK